MAPIFALSLLLAMQIADVQATHCPPSGCPADVTDDVEFIQKRVNVEPPLEKVKADEGGETADGSVNDEEFDSDEESISEEESNAGSGASDGGNGTCMSLTIRTKSWGHENSWYMPGCYNPRYGGECGGGTLSSHKTYRETCCCPGKTVVELTCKCSYGDGWHGGFIYVQESGKYYCAGFLHGYSKRELVSLGTISTTITTTTTTTAPSCIDISGLYTDPNSTHVVFLSQTGCFGLFKISLGGSRVFDLPYTVSGHQFTIHAFRLTANFTGIHAPHTLISPSAGVLTQLPNPVNVSHVYDNPGNYTCDIVFGDDPCLFDSHCVVEPNCPAMDGQPLPQTGSNASSNASFIASPNAALITQHASFLWLGEVESIDVLSEFEGLEHKAWSTSSRRRNSPKEGRASPKHA